MLSSPAPPFVPPRGSDPSPAFRCLLAALPVVSVAVQFVCARAQGTTELLLRHHTITVVDLAFIPFNYFAARDIDWRRGAGLFGLSAVAVVANVATHAYWQRHGIDPGHMIAATGVLLPAGWAHVAYSSLQMTVVLAFLFLRRPSERLYTAASLFAALYFLSAALSGYVMHSAVLLTDAVMTVSGLLTVAVLPVLLRRTAAPGEPPQGAARL
jgi:hypothetical protein